LKIIYKIITAYNLFLQAIRGFGGFVTFIFLSKSFNGGLINRAEIPQKLNLRALWAISKQLYLQYKHLDSN